MSRPYTYLKYNYGNRHFWAQENYVSTVGLNKNTIKKYIQEQEIEDKVQDKIKTRLRADNYLYVLKQIHKQKQQIH